MKMPLLLARWGSLAFYYSSAALAFATPEIRVTNAALGLVGGIWIGKRVAGVVAMLAGKNKKNEAEAGYEKKGVLKSLFENAKNPIFATSLLSATALATGYIGANTYHDIKHTDRMAVWALTGNVIDAAYKVTRPVLGASADFGQAVTHNITAGSLTGWRYALIASSQTSAVLPEHVRTTSKLSSIRYLTENRNRSKPINTLKNKANTTNSGRPARTKARYSQKKLAKRPWITVT